jgi:nucleotide-binding universal stress UspA family protein
MNGLFERVVLPVASVEDAKATVRALEAYLDEESSVVAVHVVEKAGGAPDKASVEQREEYAGEIFDVVREGLDDVETELRFATDVVASIFEAAGDHDATAIVFTPRGGSRWLRLLTGDVTLEIVTETDRPVVVLPDQESEPPGDSAGQTGADR